VRYILILFLLFATELPAKINIEKVIRKVQKKYKDIEHFSARFSQVERFAMTGSVNETSGKIFVKGGVKYRLETEDRIIVTDGKTTWNYTYMYNQVTIANMDKNDIVLLPRDLIFNLPKDYYASYIGEESINDIKHLIIKLDPKEEVKGYIKTMKLWIVEDNYQISKIEYSDLNDNPTTFVVQSQDHKTKLDDNLFIFEAPEDCEIVDFR